MYVKAARRFRFTRAQTRASSVGVRARAALFARKRIKHKRTRSSNAARRFSALTQRRARTHTHSHCEALNLRTWRRPEAHRRRRRHAFAILRDAPAKDARCRPPLCVNEFSALSVCGYVCVCVSVFACVRVLEWHGNPFRVSRMFGFLCFVLCVCVFFVFWFAGERGEFNHHCRRRRRRRRHRPDGGGCWCEWNMRALSANGQAIDAGRRMGFMIEFIMPGHDMIGALILRRKCDGAFCGVKHGLVFILPSSHWCVCVQNK